ncbi:MAG: HAD family hydrolase [Paracoccaceae bacterium]
MRARAVLFDKDGVLLDFQRTWAPWLGEMIATLADGDHALNAALADVWGYDAHSVAVLAQSPVIAGSLDDIASAVLHLLPEIDHAGLVASLKQHSANVPGVEVLPLAPLLARLSGSGLCLGIATNDVEMIARRQMQGLGIVEHFDFIAGFDSGFAAKPAPDICLAFADRLDLTPGEIVMVGDSLHDMHAGRAAGMQTVAVLSGIAGAHDLAPFADVVLADISHLPDWLAA